MVVFINQALLLMYQSDAILQLWEQWEEMPPAAGTTGHHTNTVEGALTEAGYLDQEGKKAKAFDTGSFREWMWIPTGRGISIMRRTGRYGNDVIKYDEGSVREVILQASRAVWKKC